VSAFVEENHIVPTISTRSRSLMTKQQPREEQDSNDACFQLWILFESRGGGFFF
jgi:hypothetical protein